MTKHRLDLSVGIAIAALLTLSATSAFATAVKCHTDPAGGAANGDACLFTEGVERTAKAEALTGKIVGNWTIKFPGVSTMECKLAEAKGKLNASGDGVNGTSIEIPLKTCVVVGHPECTITEPLVFGALTGQIFSNSELDLVEAGASPVMAEMSITGASCLVAFSKVKIVGTQKCTFVTGAGGIEEELAEHELKCAETGSDLEFAGKDAKIVLNEKLSLTGVAKWAIGTS